ncbi:MAG: hypothetical protein O3C59_06785 [Proteobacteria bacterium]|nr:hypothetical protein [Pseudomonadota bacterium]
MDKNRLILLVLWHIGTTNAADIRALNKKEAGIAARFHQMTDL